MWRIQSKNERSLSYEVRRQERVRGNDFITLCLPPVVQNNWLVSRYHCSYSPRLEVKPVSCRAPVITLLCGSQRATDQGGAGSSSSERPLHRWRYTQTCKRTLEQLRHREAVWIVCIEFVRAFICFRTDLNKYLSGEIFRLSDSTHFSSAALYHQKMGWNLL